MGAKLLLSHQKKVPQSVQKYDWQKCFLEMNYSPSLNHISSTSRRTMVTALTNKSGRDNVQFLEGQVTSDLSNDIRENCSTFTLPKLASGDIQPVLTKPKLLRKKDLEIERYKRLVLKTSMDCVNAISGEQLGLEHQKELRRKLHELKAQNKTDLKIEKLRNKEKFLYETEELRWQRDEARMMLENKNILIRRLRMRIKQLEEIDKQKEKEINQIKQELNVKNKALKNT